MPGVVETARFMDVHFPGRYKITIVDNGSNDKTEELSLSLAGKYETVHYIKLKERGVGLALRAGVEANDYEIVGYMDIDLSTDLKHMLDVDRLFAEDDVTIVNGSRLSKGSKIIGRSFFRRCTSYGLRFLLKLLLKMKIDDAICGFKFFRQQTIEELIQKARESPGWFYCIELLIRAERNGMKIAEIPVVWTDDPRTTVKVSKTAMNYLRNTWSLRKALKKG